MIKVFIWRVSNDTSFQDKAIKILEQQHNGIEIVGVTADAETSLIYEGKNVTFIPFTEVNRGGGYDIILVVGSRQSGNMDKITQAARQLNLPEEKLLGDWIICIPGFTLDKYRRLQRSRLSIFSKVCFGGCISNMLGLPFRSPFVNLSLSDDDFIKFLRAPRIYIEAEPHFEKLIGTSHEAPDGYPLLSLGNILLNMMHYKEVDDAIAKWNERKHRINWYNLSVITYTESEETLAEFDALPYGKKVCFVPFKSDLDSAFYIDYTVDKGAESFADAINRFGWGHLIYYDLFDMLLYGKKTPLIDM